MEKHDERHDDDLTIDLGSVTDETKGPGIQGLDQNGQLTVGGLTDD